MSKNIRVVWNSTIGMHILINDISKSFPDVSINEGMQNAF